MYDGYTAFEDSMTGKEIVGLLNEQHEQIERLKENFRALDEVKCELADENEQLRKENDMFSCELSVSANKEISRNCRIAELAEENEQLKKRIAHLKNELAYKDQHNTDKFRGIEDWAKGGF